LIHQANIVSVYNYCIVGEKRTATITADTPVELIQFSKAEFMHIVRQTNAIERLKQLGLMQRSKSWQVISANSVLSQLTSSQKTYLQSILQRRNTKVGENLWLQGTDATEAFLVCEGCYVFSRATDLTPFTTGSFLADMKSLLNTDGKLSTTLVCIAAGSVYFIAKKDLAKFLDDNPGVKVQLMNRRFIE
jgi:CRP-like cAMP-binding protein